MLKVSTKVVKLSPIVSSPPTRRTRPEVRPRIVRKLDLLEIAGSGPRRPGSQQWATEMPRVLDLFRFVVIAMAGWMNQHQLQIIDYLRQENPVLRAQLGGRRVRFNDDRRRGSVDSQRLRRFMALFVIELSTRTVQIAGIASAGTNPR